MKWSDDDIQYVLDNYQTQTAKEISIVVCRSLSATQSKIYELSQKKDSIKLKYDYNFFDIPNILNSYWAGFIAADGSIRYKPQQVSIRLCTKDKVHIEQFIHDVKYTGICKDCILDRSFNNKSSKLYYSSEVTICGPHWLAPLKKNFNIIPKKSLILEPPNLYDKYAHAFIVGYIDGDGTICCTNNRIELSMLGTQNMLLWISSIFDSICPPVGQHHSQPYKRKNTWVYKVSGRRTENILRYLSTLEIPFMARKWDIFFHYKPNTDHCYNGWTNRFVLAV